MKALKEWVNIKVRNFITIRRARRWLRRWDKQQGILAVRPYHVRVPAKL